MKIKIFGGLKDYFEPEFEAEEQLQNVKELTDFLISKSPMARHLLSKCRFAVNNSFVEPDFNLSNSKEVMVMPPSSGG